MLKWKMEGDYQHLHYLNCLKLVHLQAFMAFCEGAEADMHMYFDKAGV